jgi:hypothetical protein
VHRTLHSSVRVVSIADELQSSRSRIKPADGAIRLCWEHEGYENAAKVYLESFRSRKIRSTQLYLADDIHLWKIPEFDMTGLRIPQILDNTGKGFSAFLPNVGRDHMTWIPRQINPALVKADLFLYVGDMEESRCVFASARRNSQLRECLAEAKLCDLTSLNLTSQ